MLKIDFKWFNQIKLSNWTCESTSDARYFENGHLMMFSVYLMSMGPSQLATWKSPIFKMQQGLGLPYLGHDLIAEADDFSAFCWGT